MTAPAECPPPVAGQWLVRAVLRGAVRLLFRGLVRPPMPIAGQRAVLRLLTAATLTPRGVTRTQAAIKGVPCEWLRPTRRSGNVLLYLHGGAYLIGSPATHRAITASLARSAGLAVCALDYRLAPEHPYPAAREDAVVAYRGLLEMGYRPEQIAIAGDSAGGNLTLITTLRLKELGLPLPVALVCLSPWTDASGSQWHTPPAGDPLLHPAWLRQALELYCPRGLDRRDPGVSPLFADLAELPPRLIQVGEDEVLLNDSQRLAERTRAADVAVRLERYAGLWHVFQVHAGVLKAADQALARIATFLLEHQGS